MTVHGGEAVRFIEKDRALDLILMDLQWVLTRGREPPLSNTAEQDADM